MEFKLYIWGKSSVQGHSLHKTPRLLTTPPPVPIIDYQPIFRILLTLFIMQKEANKEIQ